MVGIILSKKTFFFKNFIFSSIITPVYEKIFGDKISDEVIKFLKNLLHIAIGTLIGTGLTFVFNVLSGRFLGPIEYGKFTLVNSISMFLYIPMLFGITTAMVKYSAEKIDFDRQRNIISTAYILVFIFTVISISIYFLFSSEIARYFSTSIDMLYYSIIFAIFFVFHLLTTSTLQSLNKMKTLSLLKSAYGIILLGSFLLFFSNKLITFESMIFSMYLAYGIVGLFIIVIIRRYLKLDFDTKYAKILGRYSLFTLFSGISHILYTNIDKILINKYMFIEDVGLYNAYYFSSINVISVFSGIFMTVFFPTICKYDDKSTILAQVNKFIPYLILLGIPFILISEYVILNLYGKDYPLNASLMLIFALTSILIVWYGIYGWTYNSVGVKGAATALRGTGIIAIVNIALNIYLIPHFGLMGAIVATALAHVIGIYVLHINKNKIRMPACV